jgi:hypothetical protein
MSQLDNKEIKHVKMTLKSTLQYLRILNGMFQLTDRELAVLATFLDKYKQLKPLGLSPFSTDVKKQIADELGMQDFNTINVYIKRLKEKQALYVTENSYKFNKLLIQLENEKGIFFEWQKKIN